MRRQYMSKHTCQKIHVKMGTLAQPSSMSKSLSRHIETTPGIRGGRPRLAGTRITVTDVALMHLRLGQSIEEIAGRYQLPLAALYAAMAYYFDHRSEMDLAIHEDLAFVAGFQRSQVSVLQERLSELRGD